MNTEDRFYFGKHSQPQRFAKIDGSVTSVALANPYLSNIPLILKDGRRVTATRKDGRWSIAEMPEIPARRATTIYAFVEQLNREGFSRPGQPERFGLLQNDSELTELIKQRERLLKDEKRIGDKEPEATRIANQLRRIREQIDFRVDEIAREEKKSHASRPGQPERFAESLQAKWDGTQYRVVLPSGAAWYSDDGKSWTLKHGEPVPAFEVRKYSIKLGTGFSRSGQPDTFDASSLKRGDFAEASKSPILGKLLSDKAMPDGGWRAVQVGSDTLVISFEDADLATDFGRRVASKGYSATSPVATTGRYWNVEVKHGK